MRTYPEYLDADDDFVDEDEQEAAYQAWLDDRYSFAQDAYYADEEAERFPSSDFDRFDQLQEEVLWPSLGDEYFDPYDVGGGPF